MSRTTISRYIHQVLHARSYKIQIHQGLHKEDYDRRVECAEILLPHLENPKLKNQKFFLDEATFHTSGRVHKQNYQIWSTEKPTIVDEYWDNSPKINVWCAMSSDCIIGPYFFESNVNGENYLQISKNFSGHVYKICAVLRRLFFNKTGL